MCSFGGQKVWAFYPISSFSFLLRKWGLCLGVSSDLSTLGLMLWRSLDIKRSVTAHFHGPRHGDRKRHAPVFMGGSCFFNSDEYWESTMGPFWVQTTHHGPWKHTRKPHSPAYGNMSLFHVFNKYSSNKLPIHNVPSSVPSTVGRAEMTWTHGPTWQWFQNARSEAREATWAERVCWAQRAGPSPTRCEGSSGGVQVGGNWEHPKPREYHPAEAGTSQWKLSTKPREAQSVGWLEHTNKLKVVGSSGGPRCSCSVRAGIPRGDPQPAVHTGVG